MCVYGGDNPEYFNVAFNSIINQSLPPTEIVLTIDGPISQEMESVIQNKRNQLQKLPIVFKVIRNKDNLGHGKARELCIQNCTNQLIALMDSDDISVYDRFKKQIVFFQNNTNISVVGGFITEFTSASDADNILNVTGKRIVPLNDADIKQYMKKRCPLNQMTVMFKKQDIEEVGGYLDWFCNEDYYLWIRLAKAGKLFANISDTLVNVRVGADMYQRRGGIKYFRSEFGIQNLMYKSKMIGLSRFVINVSERFIVQLLMPNKIRGIFFQKLARTKQ